MCFTSKAAGSRLSVTFSTSAQAALGSGCSSLVIPEQKWMFLEYWVRAPQGENPPLPVSKAPGSSLNSALQHHPWLSLASWVPVTAEGWWSLASGEWISSTLSVTMDSLGRQKAGTPIWGMTGSSSVPLFNQIADRGKTTNRSHLCYICRWSG